VILSIGLGAMAAAILCLRLGWRRNRPLVIFGWTLGVAALAILTDRWGLWGLSVGSLIAMPAALTLLAIDAMRSERAYRPLRVATTVAPPRWRAEGIVRRTSVFLLVVPGGFLVTTIFALGAEAVTRRAGWVEADRFVLALMLQPIAWAALASAQMLFTHPRGMLIPTLACALGGATLWWL
jgi:hypothetical protein